MKHILFIFGTRPEAIKLAPLIYEFKKYPDKYTVTVCVTAQHREMLDQVLRFFSIKPNIDLDIMEKDQTLFDISINALTNIQKALSSKKPDYIFVQGDTTTAFISALAGYYSKIKVAHIEAGLRSNNKYSPFPEEINRVLAGHLSNIHFAPTNKAVENLKKENIVNNVFKVGNTVIDALLLTLQIIEKGDEEKYNSKFNFLDLKKKLILVTCHRRESFGDPFVDICKSLAEIAHSHNDVEILYPVHLNPYIQTTSNRQLGNIKNIHLISPADYPTLVWFMKNSYLILTDSGGIQEEAPTLGKPVLVLRDVTERTEGVEAGTAKLVGTNKERIVNETSNLLQNKDEYEKISKRSNPYGDGTSSEKIIAIMNKL